MSSDSAYLINQWNSARLKHPFFGENLSDEEIDSIWDSSAETYGDGVLSVLHDEITAYLVSKQYLKKDSTVLDIGCGPGTYSLRFSQTVKKVVAMDKSPRMLECLKNRCAEEKIKNISTECADWKNYRPEGKFDVAFSSLCPPVNSSDSILKMEKCSNDVCVYISSMSKDRDSIYFEIWRELGREYTYEGYDTKYPFRFLESIGRDPVLKSFEITTRNETETKRLAEFYRQKFLLYRDEKKISNIIDEVVRSHAEDGKVITEQTNRLGLLIWHPFP